MGKRP